MTACRSHVFRSVSCLTLLLQAQIQALRIIAEKTGRHFAGLQGAFRCFPGKTPALIGKQLSSGLMCG